MVRVKVPATSANIGSGFDSLGLALTLYNTIGFIGIYETMKKFGCTYQDKLGNTYYTQEAADFGEKIFKTIREVADNFLKENKYDYKINTE